VKEQENSERDDENILYYSFQVCVLHENDSPTYGTKVGDNQIYIINEHSLNIIHNSFDVKKELFVSLILSNS
jgi:hypothetical protein